MNNLDRNGLYNCLDYPENIKIFRNTNLVFNIKIIFHFEIAADKLGKSCLAHPPIPIIGRTETPLVLIKSSFNNN